MTGTLWLFFLLCIGVFIVFKKNQLVFYYKMYFDKEAKHHLSNSTFEAQRITKIIKNNSDKTFGLDISHYQEQRHINWEQLTLMNGAIQLEFIVLRATMGNYNRDKKFKTYWRKAKKQELIRGAYHFYRPDEDPVQQAQSYISVVTLKSGDMKPILDVEKLPRTKSETEFRQDIQTWLDLVEAHYGEKPILYSYYHFYKDYLRGYFDEYPLWLANYNDVPQPSDIDDWVIWQFTEKGISDGVDTKIDLNIYNGSKWEMQNLLLD